MISNGYHSGADSAGVGGAAPGTIVGDLHDPHRKRGAYAMLQRAIDSAMDLPEGTMRAAASTAIRDLTDDDGRVRARAREFLLKLQDSGVGAAIGLDKIERLDAGEDTERVGHNGLPNTVTIQLIQPQKRKEPKRA